MATKKTVVSAVWLDVTLHHLTFLYSRLEATTHL